MIRPQRQRGIVGYVPQQRFNATWPTFVTCVRSCLPCAMPPRFVSS